MNTKDFTFLTEEQIGYEDEYSNYMQIDVIRKRGSKAAITDFSILLGGTFSEDAHINTDKTLAGRAGAYWTKSADDDDISTAFMYMDEYENEYEDIRDRYYGARLVLEITSINDIPTNGQMEKIANDGILEVEYGHYPQKAASKNMQEILEKEYASGNISETGNKYTTDSVPSEKNNADFKPKVHQEYEYKGKRYIRMTATDASSSMPYYKEKKNRLSNGEVYSCEEFVWIEVEPVKWLVDEEAGIMITEKVIFAGVQFDKGVQYFGENDFYKTSIKQFMDRYVSREMFQIQKQQEKNNPYNLEFDEVSEADIIRGAIEGNVSVFLHGKPGCGKSDRVKQLDPDFIELNLSHLDPELLDGLAGEKDGKAVHIKPPWLEELEEKCQEEPDKIHILFLEELTNASPMMQAKAYGIALDKKVAGRWKIPENARVVAAGNEIEDSLVANEIAEPLYDRFAHVNIETTVDSWLEWAVTPESFYERIDYKKQEESRPKIHPAIYAFISYKGEEVLRTPYNNEKPEPHADPRRWKMASDMLYASKNPNTLKAIIGEELTRDFISFCKMPTITIQDVIQNNYTEQDLEMDLGRKLATVSGLVKVDDENMPKVREFVKKLGNEMCRKFEVQWAGGDEERLEQIQELRIMEKEEKREHTAEEAQGMAEAGVLAYSNINGSYEKYLSKEKNKGEELKNK